MTLYSCLVILPLKRKWIYYPSKYLGEMKSNAICTQYFSGSSESKEFMDFLKWKDEHQNLVLWMLDDYSKTETVTVIHPFWYALSDKLTKLYDPITGNNYNPLILDDNWWRTNVNFRSKFNTKPSSILMELYFLSMQYKTIQEIIYQSNPVSLHPITHYDARNRRTNSYSKWTVDKNGKEETWFILNEYE
eukprot:490890_1